MDPLDTGHGVIAGHAQLRGIAEALRWVATGLRIGRLQGDIPTLLIGTLM